MHRTLARRFRSRGSDRRATRRAAAEAAGQYVRKILPATQPASALVRFTPVAPSSMTGGPLGMGTSCELGRGTGSEHEAARSPTRTAFAPAKVMFFAPMGNVALPAGGSTNATAGGIGM